MSATNIYNGVAMDFGAGDATITAITNKIGTFKVQSWDYSNKAKKEPVAGADGNTVSVTYYDPTAEASFEYIPSGTGLANAIAQVILPPIGTICTVTSTNYTAIAGTNWIVEDAAIKATNTKNKVISLKLCQYPNITAAAGA